MEPPEPIPNSEVKRSSADGSVGFPHVRVGHRQALILKTLAGNPVRVFFRLEKSANPISGDAFCNLILTQYERFETSYVIINAIIIPSSEPISQGM